MTRSKTQTIDFLAESDLVSLSVFLRTSGNRLVDLSTGARHHLHPKAALFLRWLSVPRSAGTLMDRSKEFRLSPQNLNEIMTFVNSIGGLRVKRKLLGSFMVGGRRLKLLFYHIRVPSLAQRWPGTIAGVVGAMVSPMIVISAMLVALNAMALFALSAPAAVIGYSLAFIFILAISLAVHELSHIFFARRSSPYTSVMRRGFRVGVLHPKLSLLVEFLSSLAGFVTGTSAAMILGVFIGLAAEDSVYLNVGMIIATFHVISLLPLYGDGESLINMWRGRRVK